MSFSKKSSNNQLSIKSSKTGAKQKIINKMDKKEGDPRLSKQNSASKLDRKRGMGTLSNSSMQRED